MAPYRLRAGYRLRVVYYSGISSAVHVLVEVSPILILEVSTFS